MSNFKHAISALKYQIRTKTNDLNEAQHDLRLQAQDFQDALDRVKALQCSLEGAHKELVCLEWLDRTGMQLCYDLKHIIINFDVLSPVAPNAERNQLIIRYNPLGKNFTEHEVSLPWALFKDPLAIRAWCGRYFEYYSGEKFEVRYSTALQARLLPDGKLPDERTS